MTNYIAAMVDELYQLGIRKVVISPGSRSTPLSILFCERGFFTYLDIDERSAGFFALGIAKEQENPVVLVCTSGSAAAHYLPALIEAKHSRVPLIVLTSDRPHELRYVGAPQTIDQNKIFGTFTKYYEDIAIPESTENMCRYVRVVMQKAYANVIEKPYGIAHINVPLREPLLPKLQDLNFTKGRGAYHFRYMNGSKNFLFDASILRERYGVIVCGGDAYADYQKSILELGERLKIPVLADPISNVRNYAHEIVIDSYDAFLKDDDIKKILKPDYILQFGQIPVSKRLQQFLDMHRDSLYIQIDDCFEYRNPLLSTGVYINSAPDLFMRSINIQNHDTGYLEKWLKYQKDMRLQLNSVELEQEMFEGRIVRIVQRMLKPGSRLVVANSMAIRDLDYFWEAKNQEVKILCNRGANGIDGTLSTALGISVSGNPTVLLTGDLAFFHDMNGMLVGKKHKLNLIIIIFNNDGGGIFSYLPQSKNKYFDYLFRTPHGMQFESLASLYNIKYTSISDYYEFEQKFGQAQRNEGIQLIEIPINLDMSKVLHDQYTTLQKALLCS